MPETDPPIVITGGSVTIEFDADQLPAEAKGKHGNSGKNLKKITIKGDGIDYTADFPTGQGVKIKIFYDNSNNPKP
jgi:hypothetical protein